MNEIQKEIQHNCAECPRSVMRSDVIIQSRDQNEVVPMSSSELILVCKCVDCGHDFPTN